MDKMEVNLEKPVENGYKNKKRANDEDFKVSGWGYRHQQCFILFLSMAMAYSTRACIGVAIVAMTDLDNNDVTNLTNATNYNQSDTFNNSALSYNETFEVHSTFLDGLMWKPPYPKFKWSKKVQDTVSASFFWGYMLLQIPASQLAHRYGSHYLLFGSQLINCVVSICLPWATYYGGWVFAVICRIVLGMAQACIVPGMHTFFGKWAPLEERGRLTAFAYGGQPLGAMLGIPITGFIADSVFGWPGIFRFYGLCSGVISIVLWFMVADSPAQHPRISEAEKKHIESGLGQKEVAGQKHLPVPWLKMLRYAPTYAIIVAHVGQSWGQVTLFTEIPSFMDKVMGVNIRANGLLCALPFLVMWLTNFFFSWFTDMLIVKNVMSVTNVRKLATTIGYLPAGLGLVVIALIPKNIIVFEVLLCIICAFKISAHVGFMVNHIDITPNFAGTMMSLSNFTSNLFGSLAPIIAGVILTDVTSERLWSYVFLVSAGIYFVTNLVYVIFADAEQAEWNDPQEPSQQEEKEAMIMKDKPQNSISNGND